MSWSQYKHLVESVNNSYKLYDYGYFKEPETNAYDEFLRNVDSSDLAYLNNAFRHEYGRGVNIKDRETLEAVLDYYVTDLKVFYNNGNITNVELGTVGNNAKRSPQNLTFIKLPDGLAKKLVDIITRSADRLYKFYY